MVVDGFFMLILITAIVLSYLSGLITHNLPIYLIKKHNIKGICSKNYSLKVRFFAFIITLSIMLITLMVTGENIKWALFLFIFITVGLSCWAIDVQFSWIPEQLTHVLMITGLLSILSNSNPITTLSSAVFGAIISGLFLYLFNVFFFLVRKKSESIGVGDIYLSIAIACWVGIHNMISWGIICCILTIVIHAINKKNDVKFAPFLISACFILIIHKGV